MGILPWNFGRNIQELKIKHVATLKHIAHLRQECYNSKFMIFQEKLLKVLKCYNFLWVQRRHNCSPVASFANCVMTLYLLKVHLHTFLSTPVTQKCQILSCDTLVANERHVAQNNCIYWSKGVLQNLKTWGQTWLVIHPPHKLDVSVAPALCKSLSLKICVFQVMGKLVGA